MAAKIASKTRVYRDMKKFLNEVIYIIKDFPKDQRYVVGDRIERTAIDHCKGLHGQGLENENR